MALSLNQPFLSSVILFLTISNLLQTCVGTSSYINYIIDDPNGTAGASNITQLPPLLSLLKPSETNGDSKSSDVGANAKYSVPNGADPNDYPSRDVPSNPLFYGWFYDEVVSASLKLISQKYLAYCYDFIPEFSSFIDRNMYFANVSDPFGYFEKPADPDTGRIDLYYHTTSKFCGRQPCPDYQTKVIKSLGQLFHMHIVGLFFTQRTYGMRVKLTSKEQNIFDVDDRMNSFQVANDSNTIDNEIGIFASSEEKGHEFEGYFHSGKARNHPLYPGIHFEPQRTDFHPTESRAHITMGCAPKVEAQQTGLDLMEIVDLEVTGHVVHSDFSIGGGDVPLATLRQFWDLPSEGEEPIFVIYPKEAMITNATFSVYI